VKLHFQLHKFVSVARKHLQHAVGLSYLINLMWSQLRSVSMITMCWMTKESGPNSWQKQISHFFTVSKKKKLCDPLILLPILWVLRVRWAGHEACHLPSSPVIVKNAWIYYSTGTSVFMVSYLIKQRDKFYHYLFNVFISL
jgi:hypothetical protein